MVSGCACIGRNSEYANHFKIPKVSTAPGSEHGVRYELEWSPTPGQKPEMQIVTFAPPTYIGCGCSALVAVCQVPDCSRRPPTRGLLCSDAIACASRLGPGKACAPAHLVQCQHRVTEGSDVTGNL